MNADEGEAKRDRELWRERQLFDLERLIRWYFPRAEWDRATWVAWQASRMDPGAYHRNNDFSVGLFGLDPLAVGMTSDDESRLLNPITNVAAAYGLWRRQGWRPWAITDWPATIAEEFDKDV